VVRDDGRGDPQADLNLIKLKLSNQDKLILNKQVQIVETKWIPKKLSSLNSMNISMTRQESAISRV
jgi:hypothetical protein